MWTPVKCVYVRVRSCYIQMYNYRWRKWHNNDNQIRRYKINNLCWTYSLSVLDKVNIVTWQSLKIKHKHCKKYIFRMWCKASDRHNIIIFPRVLHFDLLTGLNNVGFIRKIITDSRRNFERVALVSICIYNCKTKTRLYRVKQTKHCMYNSTIHHTTTGVSFDFFYIY